MKLNFPVYCVVFSSLVFVSCKKENSCSDCKNKPPIAVAGPDQVIALPTDSVLLDGRSSSDPDGTINSYLWKKISGPASFNIANAASPTTVVRDLDTGVYRFELKVTDDGNLSSNDTVRIIVRDPGQPNRPPVANAGADQVITLPANSVNLDGSSSTDPDNNIDSYFWKKVYGPSTYSLPDPDSVQTRVANLGEGTYQFILVVADAGGLFSIDTVQITVNAILQPCGTNRPVVNAQLVPVATLSQPRAAMAVASADNKILFAGGTEWSSQPSSRVDIYDITANTWSTAELCIGRYMIAATASGNMVFFGGGEIGDGTCGVDSVDIYDAATNTWSVSHLSATGNSIAAASVGNKVLFAGGDPGGCGNGSGFDRAMTVDIYNTSTNSWSTASLSERKYYISAVTLNNRIYFSGGSTFTGISKKVEVYDDNTNSWSLDTMFESKAAHGGIAVSDKIIWAGGASSSVNPTCLVEIKNMNNGNSSIEYLFKPNYWNSNDGQNLVLKDNKVIFLRCVGIDRDKFDIYDIASNTWSIGILPQPIPSGATVISVNNTVYIAGGSTGSAYSNQVWRLEF